MNNRLLLAAGAAIMSLLLSAPARAQLPPGGIPSGNPRDRATEDKLRSDEMERIKRDAEKPAEKNVPPHFPAVKEDFERIQLINNDVLQADAGGAPDYKRIADAADEIRQRATRLKTNLFAPPDAKEERKAEHKETPTAEPQTLKDLLAGLDSAIHSFVSNPMFTNLNVVDVGRSAEARRALERVIKLSAQLSKEADRLRKTGNN